MVWADFVVRKDLLHLFHTSQSRMALERAYYDAYGTCAAGHGLAQAGALQKSF